MQFIIFTLDKKYIAIDITEEMTMQDFEKAVSKKFTDNVSFHSNPPIQYNDSDNCIDFLTKNGLASGNLTQNWSAQTNEQYYRVFFKHKSSNLTVDDIKARFTEVPGFFNIPKPVFPTHTYEALFQQTKNRKLEADVSEVEENIRLIKLDSAEAEPRELERKISGMKL